MMTEEQAKTKWCPHVRYLATFRGQNEKLETAGCFNRGGADSGLETARCIASGCMAWIEALPAYPGDIHRITPDGKRYYVAGTGKPPEGYCGAFGRLA